MSTPLDGMHIAIVATNMFEESELTEPKTALESAGARVDILAPEGPDIQAARHFDKGDFYEVDYLLGEVDSIEYDALLLPGGALNADALRVDRTAQDFVREFDADNKPIAVICHGGWLLVSAGLVKGRTMTSYKTIADDIRNAGGTWVDKAVVRDENWVSSRKPDDIPEFNDEMIKLFSESMQAKHGTPREATELSFRERLDRP